MRHQNGFRTTCFKLKMTMIWLPLLKGGDISVDYPWLSMIEEKDSIYERFL